MSAKKQIPAAKFRLFLVDDDKHVRRGIRRLVDLEPDLTVCGEAEDAPTALKRILAEKPDLAIVDLELELGDGIDLVGQLHRQCPKVRILVFSLHDDTYDVERAVRAGAHGYLTKDEGTEKLIEAIRRLRVSSFYFSEKMTARMGEALAALRSAR